MRSRRQRAINFLINNSKHSFCCLMQISLKGAQRGAEGGGLLGDKTGTAFIWQVEQTVHAIPRLQRLIFMALQK